eukprot:COSAG01_NODE_235_length_20918_cov_41.045086_14_plen_86_part_00
MSFTSPMCRLLAPPPESVSTSRSGASCRESATIDATSNGLVLKTPQLRHHPSNQPRQATSPAGKYVLGVWLHSPVALVECLKLHD